MNQISERVKNELVFMNLIESLQKVWNSLSSENLFNIDEFQNATSDKLSILHQRSMELVSAEEKKQGIYDQELLILKKELYVLLKKLEEDVRARKQAMLNESKKPSAENEDEIFKLEEKLANIKSDLEVLNKSKEFASAKKKALDKENKILEQKIKESQDFLNRLRDSYGDMKNKKNRFEEAIKRKILENNELFLSIKNLESNLEKMNKEKPNLEELGEKLTKEYDKIIARNEMIMKNIEEIGLIKGKLEEEFKIKETQFKELNMKKNKMEAIYAREDTLQQQLKLENEINATLILENEVLMKQHEFMSDKSTSNSLIFLMNESLVNKMSIHQNELIELPGDLVGKNSENMEKRKIMVYEIEKEFKEKKMLIESLKAQIKNGNEINMKEKFQFDIALKITEIEDLLTASEEELRS